jgi:hypothetical protein
MPYAALNQGADSLATYDGFIPADVPSFKKLPSSLGTVSGGRRGFTAREEDARRRPGPPDAL